MVVCIYYQPLCLSSVSGVILSVCRMRALHLYSLINRPPHRTIGSRTRRQSEDEAFPVAVWVCCVFLPVYCCRSPCLDYGRKTLNGQFLGSMDHGNRENSWNEDQKITTARNMTTNGHFNSRQSRNGCFPVQKLCYHRGDLRSRDVPYN